MNELPDPIKRYFNAIHHLPHQEHEAIAAMSNVLEIAKHAILQPPGHTCKTVYIILKGAARIFYYKEGIDITDYFAFENDVLVRAESLFKNQPSRKGIEVIEDAHVLAIDAVQLFKSYDQHPGIERLFRKIFEDSYVATVNRIESLQFHDAKERYVNLLQQYPHIIQRVPLKHIASYLGITQVSLSRIRATITTI